MNKKRLIILISAAAALVLAVAITFTCISAGNKTCKIGFYGLSENVTEAITEQLEKNFPHKTKIQIIDNAEELTKKEAKKYNIIFTLNGKTVNDLTDTLTEYPAEVYNLMPTNIGKSGNINGKNVAMPILLDHYEIAYYNTYRNQCELGIPQQEAHLEYYLEKIKEKAIFPLYLAGADDKTLLGFVSLLAESSMSPEEYNQLLIDTYMSLKYDNPLPPNLKNVLKDTEEMIEKGYLYRKWYETTQADLDFAMKEHKVGAIVTDLSTHRQMPFLIIKYYDSFIYPKTTANSTGVITPEICAIIPKNKASAETIVEKLVHTDTQAELSDATKLAPVNSRAQAHDMQADDVRFMAASTSGPLPSLAQGACKTPAQVEKLATLIREYLQK